MKLLYLPLWFFRARFLGRKAPLQSVIFITEACNLRCRHCALAQGGGVSSKHKTFAQVKEEMEYCYQQGSRFIDFEGGEPTLWRGTDPDDPTQRTLTVDDLIDLAKKIGFFSCTITTNAQMPFRGSHANSIWVSMDGIGDAHDDIRGPGAFAKMEQHIADSGHPAISVNMAINNRNYESVEAAIHYVEQNPHIQLISFSFHTPYEGTEHLFLPWEKRREVIDLIIKHKKRGAPIMNSVSGLRLMKDNKFDKVCWVSNFILADGTRLDECPGKTAGVCDQCGFGMAGEMRSVFDFRPDTLRAGLKLRM